MGGWQRGLATRTAPAAAVELKQEKRRQKAELLLPEHQSMAYYNSKMKVVLERADYALATEMLARLREMYPDRPVIYKDLYNKLLFLYAQRQRGHRNVHTKQMVAILDEMIAFKRVDSRSFNSVLSACSRIYDLQLAQRVFRKMIGAGKTPGAYTYTNLILCCAHWNSVGKVDVAEGLFTEMLDNGIEPSHEVVRAMLMVYARGPGRYDKIRALIDRAFAEFDIQQDARSVKIVVEYLLDCKELGTVVKFLQGQILECGNGSSVSADVVNAVLDACRQTGEWALIDIVLKLSSTSNIDDKIQPRLLQMIQNRDDQSAPIVWPHPVKPTGGANDATEHKTARDVIATSKRRLKNAAELNQLGVATKILDEMISRGLADASCFETMLAASNRCGDLDMAETVMAKMKYVGATKKFKPTLLCYNTILNCCAEEGDMTKAEEYFQELFGYGIHPDIVTLNTMLKVIGNSCNHENSDISYLTRSTQALSLYNWCVRELEIAPDSVTHFALFRVFSLEFEHASGFAEMSQDDMHGYQDILEAVERICGEVPVDALDIGACNAAIDCFLRFNETERVHALLDVLQERSLSLSNATAKFVFASASNAGDSAIGLDFLNYAMTNNDFKPTIQVINGAIELCANTMNSRGALELFNKIETSEFLEPNEESYVNLIRALTFAGNIEAALSYARSMKDKLGVGSVVAYNRILSACSFYGQYERSLVILEEMTEEQELVPNSDTFDTIFEAFIKSGELANANNAQAEEEFFDDIVDEDEEDEAVEARPSRNLFDSENETTLVSTFVVALLEKMSQVGVSPSSVTYSQAISACAVREDSAGSLKVFDHLVASWERGVASLDCVFDDVTLCTYIKACRDLGESQRLEDLMVILEEAQKHSEDSVLPSGPLLQLMNALEIIGGWQRALWMLRNMDIVYGVAPSVLHFNRVMEMCNAAGEFRSVNLIFLTMQNSPAYHVDPNVDSYIQAIYAAEQLEQWTEATNLFIAMQQNCRKDEIWPSHMKKIALGRYSERSRHMEPDH